MHYFLTKGPGGIHLNLDATIKSIFESYSCGKENFGFDREFIVEVVSSCPSNSCRFTNPFKQGPSFEQQPQHHQNFAPPPPMNMNEYGPTPTRSPLIMQPPVDPTKMNRPLTNQQITQQILQQNHRINHQSIDNLEKQRVMQQLDKKHYETVAAIIQANSQANPVLPNQINPAANMMPQVHHNHTKTNSMDYSMRRPSYDGIETYSAGSYASSNRELLQNNWISPNIQPISFDRDGVIPGQEKIVRAFAELMKNMARMKVFIRPSMVKLSFEFAFIYKI